MKSKILYIENKAEGMNGKGRIGRVQYSKSGQSIYYAGRTFRSLKGGYKANYLTWKVVTSSGSVVPKSSVATDSTELPELKSTKMCAKNIGEKFANSLQEVTKQPLE